MISAQRERLSRLPLGVCLSFALTLAVAACTAERPPPASTAPPNILLIVAEDMSGKVGAFGDEVAQTPAIDALAREGIRFPNAFTAAGVCAPSRSALITGVYPISMGTHQMRTSQGVPGSTLESYQAVPPPDIKAFPELLRAAGYVTANFAKRDYQFGEPFTIWDVDVGGFLSPLEPALWRQLPDGKPWFVMVNLTATHESHLATFGGEYSEPWHTRMTQLASAQAARVERVTDPGEVTVPPYFPDTPDVRASIAQHYDNIHYMDGQVAAIVAALEADGLADDTIVVWTTDHGDAFPRAKRAVYDSGTRVPMVVRFPDESAAGTVREQLVSFVDLAPTFLELADAEVPAFIQGRNFLEGEPRTYVYAARDRMDETVDRQRSVRDQRYRYVRNFMPEVAYFRPLLFRDMFPIMRELWRGAEGGTLAPEQDFYFTAPRPIDELYDTEADPHEVDNLAGRDEFQSILVRMRSELERWTRSVGDRGETPELEMVESMWPGLVQPVTGAPQVETSVDTVGRQLLTLASATEGASIGYRVNDGAWQLYTGPFAVDDTATVETKAIRYGYKESVVVAVTADWQPK